MKFISRLSSITLVSCLCISSGAAVAKVTEQVSNPTSSAQTEPVRIANPLRKIREGVQIIDQVNQIRLQEQRRQEAERRQREQEAAQREAAERERKYFESLSPEQQQAYLAEKRERQARYDQFAIELLEFGLMGMFGGASNGAGTNQQDGGRYFTCTAGGVASVYVRAGERPPDASCF